MKNLRISGSIFLVLGMFTVGMSPVGSGLPNPDVVRIAILMDVPEVTVDVRGGYEIVDPKTQRLLGDGKRLRNGKITFQKNIIKIGSKNFFNDRIRIVPNQEITVLVKGKERKYRGFIDVIGTKKQELIIVNILELEDYIRGVLYHEVSHRWPMDALKAQAVASRSYVLYQMQMNKNKDYDVTSDIYSQVYGGRTSEKYRTNLAISRTAGEVLFYKGKVLPAYFHATCSGMTENVKELWNHELPPLRGVRCKFCDHSPHINWKKNFRLKDIQDRLNAKGYKLGLIKEINVLERNKSDRIRKLEIVVRDGQREVIAGKDFRNIVGPNEIRSNRYEVVMQGYYVDFIGKGWGHGVGLCQWGAQGMSAKQYNYKKILQHYYPGSDIVDYREKFLNKS